MSFYINVNGCSNCFVSSIKRLCKQTGYEFIPMNKTYYLVDTRSKKCIGVDKIPAGADVVSDNVSHKIIRNKFVNKA